MNDSSVVLTGDIVSAYVSNNALSATELPTLICSVHNAIKGIEQPPAPAQIMPEPAVSIRHSIAPDHVVCLHCGTKHKALKRHLTVAHETSPEEYRRVFGLRPDHPITAPNYSAKRSQLAKQAGLGKR